MKNLHLALANVLDEMCRWCIFVSDGICDQALQDKKMTFDREGHENVDPWITHPLMIYGVKVHEFKSWNGSTK
jgi:hypothetical protein